MNENDQPGGDAHAPQFYEIRVKGHLEARWAARFAGLHFTHADDGTTILRGPVVDQAALYGLLRSVRDLGLPLVAVLQVAPDPPPAHTGAGGNPPGTAAAP